MSETAICNQALGWLGANLLTSLDSDQSTEADLCRANYYVLRDAVLEEAEWSFAIERFQLPALQEKPISGYAYSHEVPGNILRILTVREDTKPESRNFMDWVLEGKQILSDVETIYLRALVQVTDTTKFSNMFKQALAARLAADLAIPITESRSMQESMFQLYGQKMAEAVSADNMQGRTRKLRAPIFSRGNSLGNSFPPYV